MTRARDNSNILGTSGTNGQVLTIDTAQNNGYAFENPAQYAAGKNRVINGAMEIAQRGTSFTPTTDVTYTLDRWAARLTAASKYSVQRISNSNTFAGFQYYLRVTSLAATTVGSTDYYCVGHAIEALNWSDAAWGTSSAKTVTLSFWVQSSLTGTFGGSIFSYSADASYPFTYSIPVANTPTKITITMPGATSGTWNTSVDGSPYISFGLGVGSSVTGPAGAWAYGGYTRSANGSVNVVSTNGATWDITGIQLELGSVATAFSRAGGTLQGELSACQRYFEKSYDTTVAPGTASQVNGSNMAIGATSVANNTTYMTPVFRVEKRTSPTVSCYSYAGTLNVASKVNDASDLAAGTATAKNIGITGFWAFNNNASTFTTTQGVFFQWTASAEL